MNRLRRRLVYVFLAATLAPLVLTIWISRSLLDRSLRYSSTLELDEVSRSLEQTARQYYQREREALRAQVPQLKAEVFPEVERRLWPRDMEEFWESGQGERFVLGGDQGDTLYLLERVPAGVRRYRRPLGGVRLEALRKQYVNARALVEDLKARDLRKGFLYGLILLAVAPWLAALAVALVAINRTTAAATNAYHRMAEELQQSRERLLYLTRLESWQALARKTAHEVKNSLTPIRLTMEELSSRHASREDSFEKLAAQIVADEVAGLERRVRAFTEFANEPPVRLRPLDANTLLEERVAFLRSAHPAVDYRLRLQASPGAAFADEDLLKAVLTNLLENAAQAAGDNGHVLATTSASSGALVIEVHDSGPGLSEGAREALFEPTISFKKGGMGLGLSIARKSAMLCGGDIVAVDGLLGGAGFRVLLPACPQNAS